MLIYVAHKFGGSVENMELARQKTHDLAVKDTENTYICPVLAMSHIGYKEIDYDTELEMCFDLLSACDKLIVASDISEGVRREIEMAKTFQMPIEYLR
jgi:hypothetical protein